jgi:fatty acid desaturase
MGISEIGPLRYGEDLRTFGFGFLCLGSMIAQWQLRDISKESWLTFTGFFVLTTFQSFQGGVSVHNAAHCPPFKTDTLNRAFFFFLTLWQGAPVQAYVPGHNLSHHKYLQTRRDIMRTSKMKFGSQLLNLLLFFPTIFKSIQNNDFSYMSAQRRKNRAIYRYWSQEFAVLHVMLIALLWLDWKKMLCIYFLPAVVGKDGLVTLNVLQHDGCDPKHKYNHSRNFTSDILNYLLFNNGYHTIHHMKPGVHWSLTKQQHDDLVKDNIHPNLNQRSILWYMVKTHFLGQPRVNYDGTPYENPGINSEDGDDMAWFYEQASLNADGSNPDEQRKEGASFDEAVGLYKRPIARA